MARGAQGDAARGEVDGGKANFGRRVDGWRGGVGVMGAVTKTGRCLEKRGHVLHIKVFAMAEGRRSGKGA